jgi:hypothetical protein
MVSNTPLPSVRGLQLPRAVSSVSPAAPRIPVAVGQSPADLALYLATPPAAKDDDDEILAAAAEGMPTLTTVDRDHRNTIASSRPAGPCCGDT